jgi:Fe-S cluster assembly iron-binding protein IscA
VTRTRATVLVTILLLTVFASQTLGQPAQGFGPTFDPVNSALRVNIVAGGAGGGNVNVISSVLPTGAATDVSVQNVEAAIREPLAVFNTAMPFSGVAVGALDPNGLIASLTVSSTGRLGVTCDNCSSSAANFGTVYPANGGAIGYKDALGAFASVTGSNGGLNVNVLSGGGGSSAFGTAFPSQGVSGGYRDALGAFASFTGANGKQNVIVGNESTLVATANQGASATTANAWPFVTVTDAGIMVRPGDDTNKAMRVNVVAGGTTNSSFGVTFPTTGIAAGYKDGNGSFASFTGANGRQNVIVGADSTLIATANQGASSSTANAWPIINVDDSGNMVRAGDATNKALRVNVVAGGTTGTTYGSAAPTQGTGIGYKDANGAFASLTGSNGAIGSVRYDSSGQQLGAKLPGANNVAVQVNQQPQLQALAKPTLSQLTADNRSVRSGVGSPAWGAGQIMAMLTDGQHSPSISPANRAPAPTDSALVVTQSPLPSLQCPNTTPISQTASTTLINGVAGKTTMICTLSINARDTAVRISVIEGTGTTCGTNPLGIIGGTSASYGLSATGGFHGVSDRITIPSMVPGDNICLIQDAAVNVSGLITWGQY